MCKQKPVTLLLLILCLSFLTSCVNTGQNYDKGITLTANSEGVFVAQYGDFGPPQLSNKLIGNKWWQWDDPENHQPVTYNVKVVVYRDISLKTVKHAFPVIPEEKQDYRYVSYEEASEYFDQTIAELEKEMIGYDEPESIAMMSAFPLRLYKTALAIERKLRK